MTNNNHEVKLDAAYNDEDSIPVTLRMDFGTGNSREGYFSFDLLDDRGTIEGLTFCSDVPKEKMVEIARWILEAAGEEFGNITNIYNGTVNYYGGEL